MIPAIAKACIKPILLQPPGLSLSCKVFVIFSPLEDPGSYQAQTGHPFFITSTCGSNKHSKYPNNKSYPVLKRAAFIECNSASIFLGHCIIEKSRRSFHAGFIHFLFQFRRFGHVFCFFHVAYSKGDGHHMVIANAVSKCPVC